MRRRWHFRRSKKGLNQMAHIDPFHDIDPLSEVAVEDEDSDDNEDYEREMYINEIDDEDSESEYEDDDGNIFSILQDDLDDDE